MLWWTKKILIVVPLCTWKVIRRKGVAEGITIIIMEGVDDDDRYVMMSGAEDIAHQAGRKWW